MRWVRERCESQADKRKGMKLGGEEGLEWEICVDEAQLERVSEFNYLVCALDESGTGVGECRTVVSWSRGLLKDR